MTDHSFSRRDFLKGGVGVGASAFLAACTSGGAGSSASAQAEAPAASASSAAAATPLSAAPSPTVSAGPLNFLTWNDHWNKDALQQAQDLLGITVNVTELSDDPDGIAKMQQVGGQLDIVSLDGSWVPKAYDLSLIEPFDINAMPVASQLYSIAREFDIWTKPEGYLAYPWGWSPIVIAYNPKFVNPSPEGWEALIDPKYAKRVVLEDEPFDITLWAGLATGAKDVFDMSDAELSQVKDWLTKLKPNILKLVAQNDGVISALSKEEAWLGNQNLGVEERVKKASGLEVKALVAKEGTTGFYDGEMTIKAGDNKARVQPYLEFAAQAEWVAQNFIDNGRPLFNEKSYELLVNSGKKDLADRYFYNQPELALKMRVKGPSTRDADYLQVFNSVFGA